MKAQSLYVALTATSCLAFPLQNVFKNHEQQPALRLVKLGPNEYKSLSDAELLDLKREGKNYIDVTNTIATLEESSLDAPSQPPLPQVPIPSSVNFTDAVKDVIPLLNITSMEDHLYNLTSFFTRWYKSRSGLASSLWLLGQVKEIANLNKSLDIDVFAWDNPWPQKSVIARFVGTGANADSSKKKKKTKHTDPTIVVGAHQDSINLLFPSLLAAPGADDDGSGTVTTLEAFKALVLSGFQPINTVEFHWYSAEEDGLLGSQRIFSEYFKRRINVGAMLQQDMTGFVKGTLDKGKPESIGVITDYVDPDLTDFLKSCIDEYCDIPWVETECGYACSDHASASEFGYRSAFAIESEFDLSSPFIHSTSDTIDRLSFEHMLQHAKFTVGYAYELGNTNFTELGA